MQTRFSRRYRFTATNGFAAAYGFAAAASGALGLIGTTHAAERDSHGRAAHFPAPTFADASGKPGDHVLRGDPCPANWAALGPFGGDVQDVAVSPTNPQIVLAGVAPAGSTGGTLYYATSTGAYATTGCGTGEACPQPGCDQGDVNGDCSVDLADLATLLSNFGTAGGATREQGDVSGDGNVDLTDLALLLTVFGADCSG